MSFGDSAEEALAIEIMPKLIRNKSGRAKNKGGMVCFFIM
jgi:hypothetical protein